jgi:ribosome-associated toxin RatA of RatAB toxin-antitoxin module
MYQTEVTARIDRPRNEVFAAVTDYAKLPEVFPAYRSVQRVSTQDGREIYQVRALLRRGVFHQRGREFSWKSARLVDRQAHTIRFEEIGPMPPLSRLEGEWRFAEDGASTEVSLSHRYELDLRRRSGFLAGVVAAVVRRVVRANSAKELDAFRAVLESGA